jgi:SAM-dependent methyltransferase
MAFQTDAGADEPYIFPRHPAEGDRLDVQHYALCLTAGSNYLAPIGSPRRVLDCGSGTGQWAHDLCRQFPDALVAGVDLQPGRPDGPPNFRFVQADLLEGLPFAGAQFDFVHQRLLTTGVPLAAWDGVIAELVRVTRPGGWVELVEIDWGVEPAGPATRRLLGLSRRLGRSLGLDTEATIFRTLEQGLWRAGMVAVERRSLDLPIGEWGGRIGSLMATDLRAASTRMCDVFQLRYGLTAEACRELVSAVCREWDELESRTAVAFAFGRKPPTSLGEVEADAEVAGQRSGARRRHRQRP